MELKEPIAKRVSRLNAIFAAGYSVPQYIRETGLENVYVRIEEPFMPIAEPCLMQLRINMFLIKGVFSATVKELHYEYERDIGTFPVNRIEDIKLDKRACVLNLTLDSDAKIFEQSLASSVRIIHLDELIDDMFWWAFYYRPYVSFIQRHPNITFIVYSSPEFPKNMNKFEKYLTDYKLACGHEIDTKLMNEAEKLEYLKIAHGGFDYTLDDLSEASRFIPTYYRADGARVFKDNIGRVKNTIGGYRITKGQPKKYDRRMLFFGDCRVFGAGAWDDNFTTASLIQSLCNTQVPDLGIRVENYGQFMAKSNMDRHFILNSLDVEAGDIVICDGVRDIPGVYTKYKNFYFVNLNDILERPYNYGESCWADTTHPNENGYRAIAYAIFAFLQEHDFFRNGDGSPPPETILVYLLRRYLVCRSLRWVVSGNMRCRNKFGMTVSMRG